MVGGVTVGPVAQPDPASAEGPWVGRSLPRVEDDALLRGEGRFLDDLVPVAARASTPRSCARSSRTPGSTVDAAGRARGCPASSASSPARTWPRSRGPFPAGIETRRAAVRGRDRHRPLRRRADRGRRRRATATSPRTRPSSSRSTTTRSTPCSTRRRGCDAVHDRSFSYGDVDGALARADLVVARDVPRSRASRARPSSATRVVADWDATAGRLTAWANFQGPFTLHGVAAAALGLQGRPAAPADPARLGRLVRDQVVGLRRTSS